MVSFLLIIFSAILITGIISKVKALLVGRKMPPVLQPLFDVLRLLKKGAVYSETTSLIFRIAPLIYFSTVVTAALFIPFGSQMGILSFHGDFVFFAYLLALGKFMMIIGAMDTGSGFEGMGANREALYSMLAEPAFFIIAGSLALFTGNISFRELFLNMHISTNLTLVTAAASAYVLFFIALTENSRLPVDDPRTHLELTMVHEVMVLDYSGFDLAIIHVASWMKFAIFGALISGFIILTDWPWITQIGGFLLIQITFAILVGIFESFRARNKMDRNPQWIIMLSAIAVVVFLTSLIIGQKIILF